MIGVITDTFQVPSFESVDHTGPQPSAVIQAGEMPQTFRTPKEGASPYLFTPIRGGSSSAAVKSPGSSRHT
jgi:hypothetical protein